MRPCTFSRDASVLNCLKHKVWPLESHPVRTSSRMQEVGFRGFDPSWTTEGADAGPWRPAFVESPTLERLHGPGPAWCPPSGLHCGGRPRRARNSERPAPGGLRPGTHLRGASCLGARVRVRVEGGGARRRAARQEHGARERCARLAGGTVSSRQTPTGPAGMEQPPPLAPEPASARSRRRREPESPPAPVSVSGARAGRLSL